jgi:hypothetical protein
VASLVEARDVMSIRSHKALSTKRALCPCLAFSPEGGQMLAYLGGVVSVFSRAAPDTWDVLLEHSQAVFLSVTIITPFGHSAPPFSRRRGLSTARNANNSRFFPCPQSHISDALSTSKCIVHKLNILVECARRFQGAVMPPPISSWYVYAATLTP